MKTETCHDTGIISLQPDDPILPTLEWIWGPCIKVVIDPTGANHGMKMICYGQLIEPNPRPHQPGDAFEGETWRIHNFIKGAPDGEEVARADAARRYPRTNSRWKDGEPQFIITRA